MAFVKAQIEIKPASVGTGIKVSLKRTNKASARMTVTFGDSVGLPLGWADGDKIEVLIGEGEHHGLMRLRKNNSVGEAVLSRREMARGKWFTLRLGHQPAFIDRSEPASWAQWEAVEDGWIEIVLPKWADETAPRKAAASPVPVVDGGRHVGSSPGLPKRSQNVTGQLMGDPPPGRREMLEKIGKVKA